MNSCNFTSILTHIVKKYYAHNLHVFSNHTVFNYEYYKLDMTSTVILK
jgi:hypothetical protein